MENLNAMNQIYPVLPIPEEKRPKGPDVVAIPISDPSHDKETSPRFSKDDIGELAAFYSVQAQSKGPAPDHVKISIDGEKESMKLKQEANSMNDSDESSAPTEIVSKFRTNFLIHSIRSVEFVKKFAMDHFITSDRFDVMVGKIKTKWFIKVYPNWEGSCVKVAVVRESESSSDFSWCTSLTLGNLIPTKKITKTNAKYKTGVFFISHDNFKQALLSAPKHKQLYSMLFQVDVELMAHPKQGEVLLFKSAENTTYRQNFLGVLCILSVFCVIYGLFTFFNDFVYFKMPSQ